METTIILTLRSYCLNSYFVPYELFEVALLDPGRGPRYPKCRDGRIENNLRIKKLATENHRKKMETTILLTLCSHCLFAFYVGYGELKMA